jgi:hypothetical protein
MTVAEFRERVDSDMTWLVDQLQAQTGRAGDEEAQAWQASLPKLSAALAAPALSPLHVYFAGAGYLALEYQLPAASAWCDVVLLGRDTERPGAVVVELKDWTTWGDRPGPYEGLMVRHGTVVLHPSEQVRGYVEYCRRFHSAVQDSDADVSGCVLFTRDYFANPYTETPNDRLTREYPCFTMAPDVVRERLPRYLTQRVTVPDAEFATAFVNGRYRQDRNFVRQIGAQILDPVSSPFELLDNQRRAFAMVRARLEEALLTGRTLRKQVILIDGPPGSGKSVLAAKIWATLVTDERLPEGSAVLTTTSTSQTSNWTRLFRQAAGTHAAGGVVKKAASYVPISTQELGRLRRRRGENFLADAGAWRENVLLLRNLGVQFQQGAQDEGYLVSIVDEAHALINPERPEGRGQFGFAPTLGPLAWHIIRASKVSIFLLDAEQGFRDRENTSAEQIREWAHELEAEIADPISLEGAQFRCAGSKEYVDWVEGLLRGEPPDRLRALARLWQRVLDFRVADSPAGLEDTLRERVAEGRSGRLLASFARPWATRDASNPHDLPPEMQDFHIPYIESGRQGYWSRIWNFIPRNHSDYTWFVQAPEGTPMHLNPLCEVGCPYAVRGFDFDWVGVLWLADLKRRDDQWVVDTDHVHETGLNRTLGLARREPAGGPARIELRRALAQAYRVLLTRGIYGVYLWFEDQETREYLMECLADT